MKPRNIRMVVQYEGTRYHGWQRQKAPETVQARLEDVLSTLVGAPVNIIGASRTDAGVHARRQVANFHAEVEPEAVVEHCLRYLPHDIAVTAAEVVPERFHARYLAREKRYVYRVSNRAVPDVFERRTTYHVPEPLDVPAMSAAAAHLVGSHDFASFTGSRSDAKSTQRRLDRLGVAARAGRLYIELAAPAFLLGMARIIAGTLIEVGRGRMRPEDLLGILARAERRAAGFTAPAHGLCLEEVRYDPPYERLPDVS